MSYRVHCDFSDKPSVETEMRSLAAVRNWLKYQENVTYMVIEKQVTEEASAKVAA
jgi:hypothetical protein